MVNSVKSFTDLKIWQEAHNLTLEIYCLTNKFPKQETYGLRAQLRRSAASIPANIAEGMGRNTTKELIQFIYNARGSLQETIYHLILAKDLAYINKDEFNKLNDRYNGLGKGLNVFLSKLNHCLIT
jgi:four helix bundle protein